MLSPFNNTSMVRIHLLPGEQLLPRCAAGQSRASGEDMFWGDILLGISGMRGCGKADFE